MIYRMLSYDLVLRSAIRLSLLAAAVGLAVAAFGATQTRMALFLGPVMLTSMVVVARPDIRAGVAELALPVTARQLFTVRVVSILALIWLPFLALLGAVALGGKVDLNGFAAGFMLDAGGTACCCYFLTRRLGEARAFRLDLSTSSVVLCVALGCAVLSAVLTIAAIQDAGLNGRYAFPIAAAALLFSVWRLARGWAMAPLVFELVGAPKGGAPAAEAPNTGAKADKPYNAASPWLLQFSLLFGYVDIFLIPLAAMMCIFPEWAPLVFGALLPVQTLRSIQALPLNPRTESLKRLAVVVVLMALVSLGWRFAPGSWVSWRNMPHMVVPHEDTSRQGQLILPLAYWQMADGARPPEVVAPWGERAYPPVQRFAGVPVYNPYFCANRASDAFLAWQWNRATTRVYGAAQPQTQRPPRGRVPYALFSVRLRLLQVAVVFMVGLSFFWVSGFRLWFRVVRRVRHGAHLAAMAGWFATFPLMLVSMSSVGFGRDDSSVASSVMQWAAVWLDETFTHPVFLALAVAALLAVPLGLVYHQMGEWEVETPVLASRMK